MEKELREIFDKNNIGYGEIDVDNAVKDILLLFSVSGQLPLTKVAKCGKCEMLGDDAPCDECYRNGNYC